MLFLIFRLINNIILIILLSVREKIARDSTIDVRVHSIVYFSYIIFIYAKMSIIV